MRVLETGEIVRAFHTLSKRYGGDVIGQVGYTAYYAVYVHENLETDHEEHGCGGTAKFLEKAARKLQPHARQTIASAMRRKKTLRQAIGSFLLQVKLLSQSFTPIDTGYLVGTAYYRVKDR